MSNALTADVEPSTPANSETGAPLSSHLPPSTSVAPEPQPQSLYAKQYHEAVDLFDREAFEECLKLARYHLTDWTLPRYYRIKTLVLIAVVEDNWYPAEQSRREVGTVA